MRYLVRAQVLLKLIQRTSLNYQIFRVWHGQSFTHLWPPGASYKEVGHKGAGILADNRRHL